MGWVTKKVTLSKLFVVALVVICSPQSFCQLGSLVTIPCPLSEEEQHFSSQIGFAHSEILLCFAFIQKIIPPNFYLISSYNKIEKGLSPNAPSNLTKISDLPLKIKWKDNSDNEMGFNIYVSENCSDCGKITVWHKIAVVGPNVEFWSFNASYSEKRWHGCLIVRAFNECGESVNSNELCAEIISKSIEIGPEGGMLQLDRFSVTFPSNIIPNKTNVSVSLVKLDQEDVAKDLDPERFKPIGPAFEFNAPFLPTKPLRLNLTYNESEIPNGFGAQDLDVMVRSQVYLEGNFTTTSRVMFLILPATVDGINHTVGLNIFCGGTFQVIAVSDSKTTADRPRTENENLSGDPQVDPNLEINVQFINFKQDTVLESRIKRDLNAIYDKFIMEKNYPFPTRDITVELRMLDNDEWGGACWEIPGKILIDPSKPGFQLSYILAHEFFHNIQYLNSNKYSLKSLNYNNAWFEEGTADWAADEVFDDQVFSYHAPRGERFILPLNKINTNNGALYVYETVAFWKWLELKAPGSISALIEDHRERTHTAESGYIIENTDGALYLDSLKTIHPELNFLMFVTSALYKKDFDTDETGPYDLWDELHLGQPKEVPVFFQENRVELKKGGDGDGSSHPKEITLILTKHLTAYVSIIANGKGDEALEGVLHLKLTGFDGTAAAIISRETGKEILIQNLKTSKEVTLPFGRDSEIIVMGADTQWDAPSEDTDIISVLAWVEDPCGALPGKITDVNSTEDMIIALKTVGPGNTVRLAPGSYYAPPAQKVGPPFYSICSFVIPDGVTLTGPGATIVFKDGKYQGITTDGQATIKDIILDGGSIGIGGGENESNLWLCNVGIVRTGVWWYAIWYDPWKENSHWELHIENSSFKCIRSPCCTYSCDSCSEPLSTAIEIQPHMPMDKPPGTLTVAIDNTSTIGWGIGVEINNRPWDPKTTIKIDCKKNNLTGLEYNVRHNTDHIACDSISCPPPNPCNNQCFPCLERCP